MVPVIAGTFEHFEDPEMGIRAFDRALKPGGLLAIQSPGFSNMRGDVYGTLLYLQRLPMSLTDLWQVTRSKMERLASGVGYEIESVVGGHYNFGLLDRVVEDLKHRIPAAARDAGTGADWDYGAFFEWLSDRVEDNKLLVESYVEHGFLKPVPKSPPLNVSRPADMDDSTWAGLEQYLTYDGWREIYWSDVVPYCYQGAAVTYLLRKPTGV